MQSVSFLLAAAAGAAAYTIVEADLFMHKNIDPVVMPGQYKSHLHSFFGSDAVTTNTNSSAELQAGCTTAYNPNDFSSYWVPTLFYVDGTTYTPVPFNRFSAYYIGINSAEIAIPQNFKVVVGNSSATSQADVNDLAGIQWFCEGDAGETKDAAAFPTTTCSTHLQTLLLFHDCVNEETLESAYSGTQNWNSTYKASNRCPEGMKRMPQLRFSIRYDLRTILPGGWSGTAPFELACGPSYCSHGDFINGWLPEAAENMLNATSKTEFAEVTGPLGGDADGAVCTNPTDADPDNGTDDYATSLAMMGKRKRAVGRYDRRA
ncbi:related to short-chain dehydrogenase/reductase [Phialocephala subalpina]|uniref:Related to short-chain dehydrogenase/reductase n=1 Tax=Phialocephala subalpina TaxID=576137 RepID=A0A1L7XPR2_9HELO|nr:related to short-chain dehydrogenase/reductase [Phialocephala subalpina]